MTAPSAAVLERSPDEVESTRPLLQGDFRFCSPLETEIKVEEGDAADSSLAPFARHVSKLSHPMTGEGPTVTASSVTDRPTYSSGSHDDNAIQDT